QVAAKPFSQLLPGEAGPFPPEPFSSMSGRLEVLPAAGFCYSPARSARKAAVAGGWPVAESSQLAKGDGRCAGKARPLPTMDHAAGLGEAEAVDLVAA
ncbi:hypothetical protein, partial [Glutamicibacter sp.]|uniref:hypothetical protein n=1 Tax=Glutamicibacter sp. TaxID=1931995 RepID=UPI002FC67DA5